MNRPILVSHQASILNADITFQVSVPRHQYTVVLRLEHIVWGFLLLLTLVLRLWRLDLRAMSHDESLHALYSYYLYERGEYVHSPMMHGPFLFHANALVYALLGVSDFTARLLPALVGTLVVGSMWWYRRFLGTWGALVAGLLLSISPSLLFHSRYIRNDIYVVFYSLLWVYSLLRYFEDGRAKWILGLSLSMLLGFISKENHFITGLILGIFSGGLAVASRLLPQILGGHVNRFWDVTIFMALVVLPFLSPLVHFSLGWDPLDASLTGNWRSGAIALILGAAGLGMGILWFAFLKPRHWRTSFDTWSYAFTFLGFWFVAELFFSTFLTNPRGLVSGVVESLGYWIAQQEVQRGSQPWYYYLLLTSIYEFLPFLLALIGGILGIHSLVQGVPNHQDLSDNGSSASVHTNLPILLFIWWVIGSWVAYTFAGERMPWLLSHIVTPMCLLGGYGMGRMLKGFPMGNLEAWSALVSLAVSITCYIWALTLEPFEGREIEATRHTMRWLLALITGTGLLVWSGRYILAQRKSGLPLLAAGAFVPLLLLTVRATFQLNFVNFDKVSEYLTYAHGTPDIKQALGEVAKVSEHLHGDRSVQLAYDDDNSWPMAWYFRDYPNARLYRDPDTSLLSSSIVLAGPSRWDQVRPIMEHDYVRRTYRLVWWPEESYKNWSRDTLRAWLNPDMRRRWKNIFFFRNHPHLDLYHWPHRREFDMYVRLDLAPLIWAEGVSQTASPASNTAVENLSFSRLEFPILQAIEGEFSGMPLVAPRSIRVAPNGFRVLTDSGNHRVLVLDQSNKLVLTVGGHCLTGSDAEAQCKDQDGEGPLERGDGQFNEPWGAALSDSGLLFVADTWNHRVQVFDLEGQFLTKWGQFGQQDHTPPGQPVRFFGPRGIDVLPNGDVVVVDTGNKRLLQFSQEGVLLKEVGGNGPELGNFDEPVDGLVNPKTGYLFVTDNWNHRIQLLSLSLDPIAAIHALPDMWTSVHATHKPYVVAVPDFGVAVSDPENGRIVFFDVIGQPLGIIDQFTSESGSVSLPLGLAYDPRSAELLVVDGSNNKVWVFDLSQATELLRR